MMEIDSVQMDTVTHEQSYNTLKNSLETNLTAFTANHSLDSVLKVMKPALVDATKIIKDLGIEWMKLQRIRAHVMHLTRGSEELRLQLSQTEEKVTGLLVRLEKFVATHQVWKWKKLSELVPGIAKSSNSSAIIYSLAYYWDFETSLLEEWAGKTYTSNELLVVKTLKRNAESRVSTKEECLYKQEKMISRWLFQRVMTEAQQIGGEASRVSDLDVAMKRVFYRLAPGWTSLPVQCDGHKSEFTEESKDMIETGSYQKDTQCFPCVIPETETDKDFSENSMSGP